MPAVLLYLAGIAALGGVSAFVGYLAVKRFLANARTVAFIGRSDVGKSTLAYFMEHGDLPEQELGPTTQQTSTVEVDNLTVTLIDTGGDQLKRGLEAGASATDVVYFFDAKLILDEDSKALSKVSADAEHIRDILAGHRRTKTMRKRSYVIIGTHSDEFDSLKHDSKTVRDNPVVQELANVCGIHQSEVIIGSLATRKSAKTVLIALAKKLNRDES